jgi:hypothetical protein
MAPLLSGSSGELFFIDPAQAFQTIAQAADQGVKIELAKFLVGEHGEVRLPGVFYLDVIDLVVEDAFRLQRIPRRNIMRISDPGLAAGSSR